MNYEWKQNNKYKYKMLNMDYFLYPSQIADAQLVKEIFKLWTTKCFGKNACKLLLCRDIHGRNDPFHNLIPNITTINLNVFGTLVEN